MSRLNTEIITINVLHIIETLDIGGAERVLVDLVNHMPGNINSFVCCLKHSGKMSYNIEGKNIKLVELNKKEGNDFLVLFKLLKIIKDKKIDIIHSHNWNTYCESLIAGILSRTPKVIHTIHGHHFSYPATPSGKLKRNIRHLFEKILSLKSYKICTVSYMIKKYIIDEIGLSNSKLQVIHNGIDTRLQISENEELKNQIGITNKNFVICFAGRLMPVKNLNFLISAMNELKKNFPDVLLLIVGDGSERRKLEENVALCDLEKQVKFLGFRNDVQKVLSLSDIFVLPSHYEGVSIAALEAMATGLPVIASDVGGNKEVIIDKETGFLFKSGDLDQFTDHIRYFLNNQLELKKFSKNALNRVNKHFLIDNTVSKYLKLYIK